MLWHLLADTGHAMSAGDWIAIIFGIFAAFGSIIGIVTWFVSMHMTVKQTAACLNDKKTGLVAISACLTKLTGKVASHAEECDGDRDETKQTTGNHTGLIQEHDRRIIALEQ